MKIYSISALAVVNSRSLDHLVHNALVQNTGGLLVLTSAHSNLHLTQYYRIIE